jgi:hypothetical protein
MRLGSIAHQFLETGLAPSREDLHSSGLEDLGAIWESLEWRRLSEACPEREMPFILHIEASGRDCWVRGRMDAVVFGEVPRVIDYKYAAWREGDEANYEIQMTAYSLALMKALDRPKAAAELWYLKQPLKIVRQEYARARAEERMRDLVAAYLAAVEQDRWPAAGRAYCDRMQCGFRPECWR